MKRPCNLSFFAAGMLLVIGLSHALAQEQSTPPAVQGPVTIRVEADGTLSIRRPDQIVFSKVEANELGKQAAGSHHANIEAAADVPYKVLEEVWERLKQAGVQKYNLTNLPKPKPEPQIKIFSLANGPSLAFAQVVQQVFSDKQVTIAAEPVTNTIIARGDPQTLLEVEAVLLRLDANPPPSAEPTPGKTAQPSEQPPDSTTLNALRTAYERAEAKAGETATRLRRPGSTLDKGQLLGEVTVSFEARQNLQRAELAALRERLGRIEQSIAARERVKDKILEKRVAELLDPNLQWEPTDAATAPKPATTARHPEADPTAQTHPELRFKQVVLQVAQAEYESAQQANKKAPGSITHSELRRLKLMVEKAAAELELLLHNVAAPPPATPTRLRNPPTSSTPGSSFILRSPEEFGELGQIEEYVQRARTGRSQYNCAVHPCRRRAPLKNSAG